MKEGSESIRKRVSVSISASPTQSAALLRINPLIHPLVA